MALIQCPECTVRISDLAPACPKCGAPIASEDGVRTTIQETSKQLKLQIVFSSLLIVTSGVVVWVNATGSSIESVQMLRIFGLLFVVGLIWYTVTRFRIWWHHK